MTCVIAPITKCTTCIALLVALVAPSGTYAQGTQVPPAAPQPGLQPLGKSANFLVEFTRNVSAAFSGDVTGSDFQKIPVQFSRSDEGFEIWNGQSVTLLIDPKTYFFTSVGSENDKLSTIEDKNSRGERPFGSNMSWKSDRTIAAAPVSWCKDNKSRVDSKFESLAPEKFKLKIDGQETTIDVIPVVEKGYWYRCYSGKRYARILVSRELNAVVFIGYLTYDPYGNLHAASNRVNVVEIAR